jgi:hypothetical protein
MDFKAFYVIAECMEVVLKLLFLEVQRFADFRAQTTGDSVELKVFQKAADFLGELFGSTEIDGSTDAIFKISEYEIWSQTGVAVFSPSSGYGTLIFKKSWSGKELRFYFIKFGGHFLVPKSRFFHVCWGVDHDFFTDENIRLVKHLRLWRRIFGIGQLTEHCTCGGGGRIGEELWLELCLIGQAAAEFFDADQKIADAELGVDKSQMPVDHFRTVVGDIEHCLDLDVFAFDVELFEDF